MKKIIPPKEFLQKQSSQKSSQKNPPKNILLKNPSKKFLSKDSSKHFCQKKIRQKYSQKISKGIPKNHLIFSGIDCCLTITLSQSI